MRKHLGYFETPEAASAAYMQARGSKASAARSQPQSEGPAPRRKASEVRSVPAGEIAVEVVLDLLPKEYLLNSLPGQPEVFLALEQVTELGELARLSRAENVSLHTAAEVALCCMAVDGREEAVRGMVRALKRVGLQDRASEVADLVTAGTGALTFEGALLRLSGAEDLV